ncbi:hypothetical protein BOX15_Mlig006740g1 [Macrostomum lignano]|uniref:NADH dehydrogenase [ubiquinone] 1 beta subcomplex subunit 5, mitochondrial n=1 Tax=Macrostomum lignano TaxID=282301 RepID=A0A267E1H4_9PLAT|nr:hypothetical protein BOX15_Mlig010356g3 [Macrostomum lignano]PAA65977.1 hypothetical protein BOX15_Mlig010356g2 [Macrostomum lignano]PAA78890.1 hypothetical protein BOX15_Mlig006740g1 [Macrostomum lignano]
MSLLPLLTSSIAQRGCSLQLTRLLSASPDLRCRGGLLAVAFMSTAAKPASAGSALRSLGVKPAQTSAWWLSSLGRQPVRWGGGGHGPRKMLVQPSRYQWDHMWDDYHYYFLLGVIPCATLAIILYIFVGPAELTELPEDYEPQEYEYHRHPLTRAIAWFKTHYVDSDQEMYERVLAYKNEEYLRMMTKKQYRDIKHQESLLGDYRGYYFVPVNPRPVSQHHSHRQIDDLTGDLPLGYQSEDPRELPTDIGAPAYQY